MEVRSLDQVMTLELQAYPFPWSRGNFVDALASGYLAQCLWAPEGQLLGYHVSMAGVDEWHLLNLSVAPALQGRGHGLMLLRALEQEAIRTRAEALWLEVRPSNERALRLYRRFGFEEVGRRKAYYPDHGGGREDALVLRCPVPAPGAVAP
nr:ribosomal protein S18-alanine N-acetyltransferase [Sphaerotilus hippei]